MRVNQEVFSETLLRLAKVDHSIYVVTSDSRGSGKLVGFGNELPGQIVETGIAEQNLVGVAAGMASMGKKVFAISPACFLTARALEQVKNDVAYSDNPVKLIGISAGVSYGALGTTHHSLHDFAVLRAINNINILAPADEFETRSAVEAVVHSDHPAYLRFGKKSMPDLGQDFSPDFEIGKARIIKKGHDVALIGTGETVWPCLEAAELLSQRGIEAEVISMHSIRPLDHQLLHRLGQEEKAIITVEEHFVHGGLGEAVASFLMQNRFFVPFKIIGIPDEYTVTGSQSDIFSHYAISAGGITAMALKLLHR